MARFWEKAEGLANRVGIWFTGFIAVSAFFGWVSSHLNGFNWADDIIVGFLLGSLAVLALAAGLAAWRFFRPLPPELSEDEILELPGNQVAALDHKMSNLLEAQENRLRGAIAGPENHVRQLHELTQDLTRRLAEIERRTAFPSNMGDTLGEALESAEQCRLSQIERIREAAETATTRLNNAHMEMNHLLNFNINAATRGTLGVLLKDKPNSDKSNPPLENEVRGELILQMRMWLQHIRDITSIAAYGIEMSYALQSSAQEGEVLVRQMPASERPQAIDAYAFHDFFVPAHQCERMATCLENVIQSLNGEDRQSLERLREFLALRNPKRN